ncbi:MAG: hypothetical protein DRJ18_00335 [Candidatus Methanomethylicota archaeon]|nr:MAG: hypothetical protein DRJ18_00335 [Candidatus Verstraetearchaeota archaeon]
MFLLLIPLSFAIVSIDRLADSGDYAYVYFHVDVNGYAMLNFSAHPNVSCLGLFNNSEMLFDGCNGTTYVRDVDEYVFVVSNDVRASDWLSVTIVASPPFTDNWTYPAYSRRLLLSVCDSLGMQRNYTERVTATIHPFMYNFNLRDTSGCSDILLYDYNLSALVSPIEIHCSYPNVLNVSFNLGSNMSANSCKYYYLYGDYYTTSGWTNFNGSVPFSNVTIHHDANFIINNYNFNNASWFSINSSTGCVEATGIGFTEIIDKFNYNAFTTGSCSGAGCEYYPPRDGFPSIWTPHLEHFRAGSCINVTFIANGSLYILNKEHSGDSGLWDACNSRLVSSSYIPAVRPLSGSFWAEPLRCDVRTIVEAMITMYDSSYNQVGYQIFYRVERTGESSYDWGIYYHGSKLCGEGISESDFKNVTVYWKFTPTSSGVDLDVTFVALNTGRTYSCGDSLSVSNVKYITVSFRVNVGSTGTGDREALVRFRYVNSTLYTSGSMNYTVGYSGIYQYISSNVSTPADSALYIYTYDDRMSVINTGTATGINFKDFVVNLFGTQSDNLTALYSFVPGTGGESPQVCSIDYVLYSEYPFNVTVLSNESFNLTFFSNPRVVSPKEPNSPTYSGLNLDIYTPMKGLHHLNFVNASGTYDMLTLNIPSYHYTTSIPASSSLWNRLCNGNYTVFVSVNNGSTILQTSNNQWVVVNNNYYYLLSSNQTISYDVCGNLVNTSVPIWYKLNYSGIVAGTQYAEIHLISKMYDGLILRNATVISPISQISKVEYCPSGGSCSQVPYTYNPSTGELTLHNIVVNYALSSNIIKIWGRFLGSQLKIVSITPNTADSGVPTTYKVTVYNPSNNTAESAVVTFKVGDKTFTKNIGDVPPHSYATATFTTTFVIPSKRYMKLLSFGAGDYKIVITQSTFGWIIAIICAVAGVMLYCYVRYGEFLYWMRLVRYGETVLGFKSSKYYKR